MSTARVLRASDPLHAGPTGREYAAFRAAVHTAQQHPQFDGTTRTPGGALTPAAEATGVVSSYGDGAGRAPAVIPPAAGAGIGQPAPSPLAAFGAEARS